MPPGRWAIAGRCPEKKGVLNPALFYIYHFHLELGVAVVFIFFNIVQHVERSPTDNVIFICQAKANPLGNGALPLMSYDAQVLLLYYTTATLVIVKATRDKYRLHISRAKGLK